MNELSRKQKKFIIDNAGRISVDEMARQLGVTDRILRRALKDMGIDAGAEIDREPPREKGKSGDRRLGVVTLAAQQPSLKWIAIAAAVVIALTSIVYGRGINYPFVFDDHHAILDNIPLKNPANIIYAFFDPAIFSDQPERRMYRPIVTASYVFNMVVFKDNMIPWHLFNFIFHIANGILLFLILDYFISKKEIALIVTALFTAHPAATESVIFLAARSTIMAGTFILLSIYYFLRWSREKQNYLWLAISAASFGLGLLCKENVIMLVPLYPLIFWAATDADLSEHFDRENIIAYAVMIGIALLFMAMRTFAFDLKTAVLGRSSRPFSAQIMTQAGVWWRYFGTMFWPIWMNVYREIDLSKNLVLKGGGVFGQPNLWIIGWILMAAPVILTRRNRLAFFGAAFAVIMLLPETATTLNLLSADRRMYFPMIGLALIVASPFRRDGGIEFSAAQLKAWIALMTAILLLYIPLSIKRIGDWQTEKTLFYNSVRLTPKAYVSWHGLGFVFGQEDKLDKAELCLKQALEIDPNYGASLRLLGAIYLKQQDPAKAMPFLEKAVRVEPLAQRGWYNLGLAYMMVNDVAKGEAAFKKAVEQDKYYAQAYNNLGVIYQRQGKYEESYRQFEMAAKVEPGNGQYRRNVERAKQILINANNGLDPMTGGPKQTP